MDRKQAGDFDPRALVAYDDFAHGRISRREFATRLAGLAGVGLTAEALIEALTPNYAWAQQVSPEDPRIVQESFEYNSEKRWWQDSRRIGLSEANSERGR